MTLCDQFFLVCKTANLIEVEVEVILAFSPVLS
jgi:hypothetical protein